MERQDDYLLQLAGEAHQRGAQQSIDSLVTMAKYMGPFYGQILEIGTGKGGTTWFLSHASPGANILTIDIEDKSRELNITDCRRDWRDPCNVTFQLNKEFKGETNPYYHYDLIIIDGDHSYKGVFDDLQNYLPFLKVDGFLYMHDTNLPRVAQAAKACLTGDEFTLCEEHLPPTPGAAGWRVYQRQFAYSYIEEN